MADDQKVKISLSAKHIADLDQQLVQSTQGSQAAPASTDDPHAYKGYIEVAHDAESPEEQATIHASPEAVATLHDALQKFVDSDASFSTVKHSSFGPSAINAKPIVPKKPNEDT